jgi:hypothetical protein
MSDESQHTCHLGPEFGTCLACALKETGPGCSTDWLFENDESEDDDTVVGFGN